MSSRRKPPRFAKGSLTYVIINVKAKKRTESYGRDNEAKIPRREITRKKKWSDAKENVGIKKHKKEPLPMKLRAFPQSFWQQPNKTPSMSPGTVYCTPSLLAKEETSPEADPKPAAEDFKKKHQVVSEANVDLLFSLFRNVEADKSSEPIVRRGRPRKPKESKVVRDDDPYLSSSAAGSMLPLLPIRKRTNEHVFKIAQQEPQSSLTLRLL